MDEIDSRMKARTKEVASGTGGRFALLQKGTVAFLLLSTAASLYEAFLVAGTGSAFFAPLFLGGLGRVVVAGFCAVGERRAFSAAVVFAVISSGIDLSSCGGDYVGSAVYVIPQLVVVAFALLALRQYRYVPAA